MTQLVNREATHDTTELATEEQVILTKQLRRHEDLGAPSVVSVY